ncbi:radical SAM protein, partial [Chloroflexota bacterium]
PDGQSVGERRPRFIYMGGGTITHGLKGESDTDFYLKYINAIKKAIGNRYELALGIEAKTKEDNKRLHDAGVNVVCQDIEVWDKRLYPIICPGKAKIVGDRDEWVKRLVEAVDIFGEGHVITALVGGIEMAQPYGFKDIDSAVNSTTEGIDYLLSHGVHPELFVWAIEPGSALAGHPPIPLEYYIRVNQNFVKLWKKYRQPVPTYIQPIGPGNATFHLSPYIDAYC